MTKKIIMQKIKMDELGLYVIGGAGDYRPAMTDDDSELQNLMDLISRRFRKHPLGTTQFKVGDRVAEIENTLGSLGMLDTSTMLIWSPRDKSTLEMWFCKIQK